MAGLLASPLLLLLALNTGGARSSTMTQNCASAFDIILKEGETQTIKSEDTGALNGYILLLVIPESSFQGVRVDVYGRNGWSHTVWFPAECECFQDSKWQGLYARAMMTDDRKNLRLVFEIGVCRKTCIIKNPPQSLQNLSVVAYGSSRWIKGRPPTDCDYVTVTSSSQPTTPPICESLPSSKNLTHGKDGSGPLQTCTTTTTPNFTIGTAAVVIPVVVVVVVVVVLVVIGVLWVCRRRQLQLGSREE